MNYNQIFLISLGYVASIIIARNVIRKKSLSTFDKLLLIVIGLIPLGKLVYIPPVLASGLKFCFIFAALVIFVWFIIKLDGVVGRKILIIGILLVLPVLTSILFMGDYSKLLLYNINDQQRDSILLRAISQIVLVAFMIVVVERGSRNSVFFEAMQRIYLTGLWMAIGIGLLMFIGVFNGVLSGSDLVPISADYEVHIVGRFFRFNPGSNVNEFGMLIGYGIIFYLLREKFEILKVVALLVVLFFTLTRAAWIGVFIGLFVYVLMSKRGRSQFFPLVLIFSTIFVFLYFFSSEIQALVDSRLTLDIGASGYERLDKYQFVFDALQSQPIRWLFGFGWSTNMYVHSVPLQLLYETGLIGVVLYYSGIIWLFLRMIMYGKGQYRIIGISALTMCLTFSLVHHTLYHMQTSLILALCYLLTSKNHLDNLCQGKASANHG